MLSEISKDTKCYPAHTIYQKIAPEVVENLLGFHAITWCDTCHYLLGIGRNRVGQSFFGAQSYLKV